MSQTYKVCHYCHEAVYEGKKGIKECRDACERSWCNINCAEADGFIESDIDCQFNSCRFCRGDDVEDNELLAFILCYYKITREEAIKMYKPDWRSRD